MWLGYVGRISSLLELGLTCCSKTALNVSYKHLLKSPGQHLPSFFLKLVMFCALTLEDLSVAMRKGFQAWFNLVDP